MHRKSLRLLFAAAALCALPALAFGQTSRVEGMNVPGDYIKDYTAIYGWPSSLPTVGNLIYGELGNVLTNSNTLNPGTLDRGMGAVLNNLWDGRFGVWGIHLREETPALGQGDNWSQPNLGDGGGDPNRNTNQSFDIMWGKKFGGTNFGLRLNRSYYQLKDEITGATSNIEYDGQSGLGGADGVNLSRNVMGFGAGLGWDLNPDTQVEVSATWQSRTFENKQTVGSTSNSYEDDGPTTYMLAGRAMWKWQSNVMVTPVFKYYSFDLSNKFVNTTTTSYQNSLKGWQAGIAGNWSLNQNDLFVLGFAFAQNKLEQQFDVFGLNSGVLGGFGLSDTLDVTETLSPQVFGGLEVHPSSWLTLRFGAQKGMFHTYKAKDAGSNSETVTLKNSPFSLNMGAGVKLGTLQLDAVLDTFFAHNPIAQLMGGSNATYGNSAGVAFPKVTATYTF